MEVSGLQDTYDRVLTSLFGSAVPCDCLAPASPLRKGLLHRFLASSQTEGILSLCIASPFAGVFSVFFVMRVNTPMAFFCPHVTPDSARAFNAF